MQSVKTRLVIIGAVVVVVVAVLAVVLFARSRQTDTDGVGSVITAAGELAEAGDYEQALLNLQQAEGQAQSTDEKLAVLSNLAAAAANAGQLSQAISYYEQKHQLSPASAAADGLLVGELYERLGENAQAIQQFELYLGYLKNNPTEEGAEARIRSLESRIEQLKAGQP